MSRIQQSIIFHRICTWLILGYCLAAGYTVSEAQTPSPEKRHRFTVYAGGGPNYYFNNVVALKNEVNELNYSFAGRIMWEPEHRLSIGLETGYYRLYTLNLHGPKQTQIKNSAIPLQLVLSMKFFRSFYGSFAIGRSILINDITTNVYGNFDATTFSLADFSTSVGYRRKINYRYTLGIEGKFYLASKADDKNIALLFMMGYSFH